MQQRLNSSYGSTLLRAYFGIYHGTETNATVYSHNDSYITDYNSYMDGLRLEDFTLKLADGTAWLANERSFRDSSMLTVQQYKDQFIHIDNWCGTSPCLNDDSVLNGLGLESDRTWSIIANVANLPGGKCYSFFTTQKKLVISKGVLSLV